MKFFLVLAAVAVAAVCAAPFDDSETTVLQYENEQNEVGEYSFTVELSDGTIRHEESKMIDVGLETEHMIVKGYFEHKGPDGVVYHTDYSANAEGFNAHGDHLPRTEEQLKFEKINHQ